MTTSTIRKSTKTAEQKRVGRKRQIVATGVAMAMAGSGAALAIYLSNAGISGSLKAAEFTSEWSALGTPTVGGLNPAKGRMLSGATVSNGVLNLQPGTGAFPQDEATVTHTILVEGSTNGMIGGLNMASLPPGYEAELDPAFCGLTVPKGSIGEEVTFTIRATDDLALDGSLLALNPESDGLYVAPFSSRAEDIDALPCNGGTP